MITSHTRARLQAAADYRTLRTTLRYSAIFTILWGALALVAGVLPPMDMAAIGLGMILVSAGFWNRIRIAPSGMIIAGGAIMLVGLYNIASSMLPTATGAAAGFGFWAKLGVFQLLWGGQSIARYPRYSRLPLANPDDPEVQVMEESITRLLKARVRQENDVIEFVETGFSARLWRVRLEQDGALLVAHGARDVIVAGRNEVQLQLVGQERPGKTNAATFAVAGKTLKGAIKPESLARYRAWQAGAIIPQAIAA